MSLIVEDGTGIEDADSYMSVAEADTYHTAHSQSTDWSDATEAVKEKSLRLATQYLDTVYHTRWKATRTHEAQALDWPRALVDDRDGYAIDSDEIPQKLKDAEAELALLAITETNGLSPNVDTPGDIKKTSVKVGPITESIEYAGSASQYKKFSLVDRLLVDYLEGGMYVARG
jgi:hypothetical protein